MATYTSNYGWTKPSGSDNVDISVLNDNLDNQDSTIHDAFLNMAPPFSESSTYAVDDIVLYTTGLYKCHTAVVTPGSWTGSTNWQVYKLSEGGSGGGGTSNYNDLTNKPSINGVTLSGNKTTSALGIDKTAVGLGNVPNVSTNNQTPTFSQASTRNNIASGEKLSVILGKIAKFFNDLKTVAFSGSFSDLSNKPSINSVELSGNKTTSDLGINADNVMMSDGTTSVEDALYANSFGTVVNLASYSSSNPYTCPSDGYVVVKARELNGYVVVTVIPKSGDSSIDVSAQATANNYVYNALFVKKGMKLYPLSTITTNLQAKFVPLVM